MLRRLLPSLFLLLAFCHLAPASAQEFLDPRIAFKPSLGAVDDHTVEIRYAIAKGYYLYRAKFKFAANTPGVRLGQAQFPAGKKKQDDNFGTVEIYYDAVTIRLPVERNTGVPVDLDLTLTEQGCADAGVCYPPQDHALKAHLPAAPVAAAQAPPPPPAPPPLLAAKRHVVVRKEFTSPVRISHRLLEEHLPEILVAEKFRKVPEVHGGQRSVEKTGVVPPGFRKEVEEAEFLRRVCGQRRLDLIGGTVLGQSGDLERRQSVKRVGDRRLLIAQELQRKFVEKRRRLDIPLFPVGFRQGGQPVVKVDLLHRVSAEALLQALIEFGLGGDPLGIGPLRRGGADQFKLLPDHVADQVGIEGVHHEPAPGQALERGLDGGEKRKRGQILDRQFMQRIDHALHLLMLVEFDRIERLDRDRQRLFRRSSADGNRFHPILIVGSRSQLGVDEFRFGDFGDGDSVPVDTIECNLGAVGGRFPFEADFVISRPLEFQIVRFPDKRFAGAENDAAEQRPVDDEIAKLHAASMGYWMISIV